MVPVNLVLKTTKDLLSDKLVKTAVKMMTTQRKRKLLASLINMNVKITVCIKCCNYFSAAFCISMPLRVDTLAMIHRSTKLLDLYTVLVEASCRSLRLLESVLIEQLGM